MCKGNEILPKESVLKILLASYLMLLATAVNASQPESDGFGNGEMQPSAQSAYLAFMIADRINGICNLIRPKMGSHKQQNINALRREVDRSGSSAGSLFPPYARMAGIRQFFSSKENEFSQFIDEQPKATVCAESSLVEPSRQLLAMFTESNLDIRNWISRGSYIQDFPKKYLVMASISTLPVVTLVSGINSAEYVLVHKPRRFPMETNRLVPFHELASILRFRALGVENDALSKGIGISSALIGTYGYRKLYAKKRGYRWNGPDQFAIAEVREHFKKNVIPRIHKATQQLEFPINLMFIRKFEGFNYEQEAQVFALANIRPLKFSKRFRDQFFFAGDIEIDDNGVVTTPDRIDMSLGRAREVAEVLRPYESWGHVWTSINIDAVENRRSSEPTLVMSFAGQEMTTWEKDPAVIIESMETMATFHFNMGDNG